MSEAEDSLRRPTPGSTLESGVIRERRRLTGFGLYARLILSDKLALVAALFLILLTLAAIFAPVVAPFPPNDQSLLLRNEPPMTAAEDGVASRICWAPTSWAATS